MLPIPVDFRHGRGADQGASLGQGSLEGSKDEPGSRDPAFSELRISAV
jgi:hypothetical protein